MTKRLLPVLSALGDVVLLWICLLVTFHLLPADRPDAWQLLAPAILRLLVGASSAHAWRNNAIVVLISGLLFHFLWGRGQDIIGLAAWFVLSTTGRGLARWLRQQAGSVGLIRSAAARGLKSAGRLLAVAGRHGLAAAAAPSARYVRVPLLLAAGTALMWPYLTSGVLGAGDALWYSNMVADFITQMRAGIFPVWIGQTDFAFMGATFPLRMAPWLQHLTGLIDLLTGQRLSSFTLLNLALTGSLLGGLLSCYFCVAAVLPRRPWTAAALAFLYATCPGVLGLAYTEDLYLSVTTLPFLPVIFLGIVRSFERDDALSRLLIAGGLAATWMSHPPIAVWCGLVAAATQLVRVFSHGWTRRTLLLDLLAVAVFAALAAYSFVSVMSLGPRIVDGSFWLADVNEIRGLFPGTWLPLPRANRLENMQLGYGLAVLLGGVLVGIFRRREPLPLALGLCAAALFTLVVPIPVLNGLLWHAIPLAVLRLTKGWPTLRLLVVLALCIVFSAALQERWASARSRVGRAWAGAALLLALAWSGFQAFGVTAAAARTAQPRAVSWRMQRPENLLMTRAILGVAPIVPRAFSNGVMDPQLEHHFLDRRTRELRGSAIDAIAPGFGPGPKAATAELSGVLTGKLDANPGMLDLSPELKLEPGRRYLLLFQFLRSGFTGVLIIHGDEFYREYELPPDGGTWSFGPEAENAHALSLWTTLDRPETVQLQFVPTGSGAKPLSFTPFARFELRPYEPAELSVQLKSLLPYRATVRSDGPAYLETPRLFVPGYEARVDGVRVPVDESPDGLVIVPLTGGTHALALDYVAPFAVRASYWGSLAAWMAFFIALFLVRNRPTAENATGRPSTAVPT